MSLATLKPGKKKDAAVQELLVEGRADELAILRDLGTVMKLSPKKLWLLSLVTKQDLWTADKAEVRAHYSAGEYADAIRDLEAARGDSFRHEIAFASLVISTWVTGSGERLKKNVEGYDHEAQVTSVRRVFDALDGLRQWEK